MTDCAEDDNGCCRHHRDEITGLRVSLNLAQAQKACLKAERNNAQADLVEVKSQADILIKNLQGQLNSLRPELRKVKEELRAMRNEDTLLKEEIKLVVGYSAELNQQLETLKPKASEATEFTEHGMAPRKKRKMRHDDSDPSRGIVVCTQCYAHGLVCDAGEPCNNCLERKATCKRKQCATYALGASKCLRMTCPFAHPEDGYQNTIVMTDATKISQSEKASSRNDTGTTSTTPQVEETTTSPQPLGHSTGDKQEGTGSPPADKGGNPGIDAQHTGSVGDQNLSAGNLCAGRSARENADTTIQGRRRWNITFRCWTWSLTID